MKKVFIRNLLFLFYYFIFPICCNATIEELERVEAAKMHKIQEIKNAIHKFKSLQFLMNIDFQIHREYKIAAENLMEILYDARTTNNHAQMSQFPLPWLLGLDSTISLDQRMERQRILVNAFTFLKKEVGHLIALPKKNYAGLFRELWLFTPRNLMRNSLKMGRELHSWLTLAGQHSDFHIFSPSRLNLILSELSQFLTKKITNREGPTINEEIFGRNELKRWTKIVMEELMEATKRSKMDGVEIERLKMKLNKIQLVRIDFEEMYLSASILYGMFHLVNQLCTPSNAQEEQQQNDPILMFKENVKKLYERTKKDYGMIEQGRELANLMAVNLLPNVEKEKGETSKKEIEPRKNIEKDIGNNGKRRKIAQFMPVPNLDMEIGQKGDENRARDLEGGSKDYHKVLKVLRDKLIDTINLPKTKVEFEAETFEFEEGNNLEKRLKLLEADMMANIGELIELSRENHKYWGTKK